MARRELGYIELVSPSLNKYTRLPILVALRPPSSLYILSQYKTIYIILRRRILQRISALDIEKGRGA